jgi:hypothetical protein
MNTRTVRRLESLEAKAQPTGYKPWRQVIDDGSPEASGQIAELLAAGFNVIQHVIVDPKHSRPLD